MRTTSKTFSLSVESRQGRGQRSRWLWLLVMLFTMTVPFQEVKAGDVPHFSDVLGGGVPGNKVASPSNPWIKFRMLYQDMYGDVCNWQNGGAISIYADGEYQGTLNEMGCATGSQEADWSWKGKTFKDCRIELYNKRRENWAVWVDVYILFFNNTYGQKHTFELRGTWAFYYDHYYYDGVNRICKYTTDPVSFQTYDLGTVTKVESQKVRWTSPTLTTTTSSNAITYTGTKAELYSPSGKIADVSTSNVNQKTLTTDYNVGSNYDVNTLKAKYYWNLSTLGVLNNTDRYSTTFVSETGWGYANGYPKPKITGCSTDMWGKKVTLTWTPQFSDNNHKNTAGNWYIQRTDNVTHTTVVLGDVGYSTTQYTDDNDGLAYSDSEDNRFTYTVTFVPNNWAISSCSDLQATTTTAIVRQFSFTDLALDCGEKSLTFTWHNPAINGSGNDYKFKVFRKENNSEWEEITEISVTDKKKTSYTYVDSKVPSSCNTYYYKVGINVLDKLMESAEVSGNITGSSRVDKLEATKGDYTGAVKLNWTAIQVSTTPTFYQVFRRVYGSETGWVSIYTVEDTKENYFYEDNTAQPGTYYEYRVGSSYKCDGVMTTPVYVTDDGFCRATGVISGKVTYGSGMAVAGVRVMLKKDGDNQQQASQFYSLRMPGKDGGIRLAMTDDELTQFSNSPYSIQLYVNPEETQESGSTAPVLIDLAEKVKLTLGAKANAAYPLVLQNGTQQIATGLTIPAGQFSSITLTKAANGELTVYVTGYDGQVSVGNKAATTSLQNGTPGLAFGGAYTANTGNGFTGFVDEMRVFSGVALSEAEIAKNYNHTLSGNEDGLFAYWPADEGFKGQTKAYDYSKTAGVANGHHGKFGSGTYSVSDVIPDSTQLGILGYSDVNGNYVIRGVPFSGEGTNYTISPSMGIHKFNPIHASRYVSYSSLVHSGVDFEDVSSFTVKGTVYYKNTTYPVEGVSFAVDGITCTMEGNIITTDANGEYEISVPIGDHYITMSKSGHTFENDGRYPANPDANSHQLVTFDQEVSNLIFYDTTLVPVAGRVVGGATEAEKPLGFGTSENNIGQAKIVMTPTRNNVRMNVIADTSQGGLQFVTNPNARSLDSATDLVGSVASVGGGANGCNNFTITTDSRSGEFAVMVPPLEYRVTSITIPSQPALSFDLPIIDATTLNVITDSIANEEGGYDKFDYKAKLIAEYDAQPTLTVTQVTASGQEMTGYGDQTITVDEATVPLYTIGANGVVTYNYSYPIFQMFNDYFFKLKAFEEYKNLDDPQEVKTSYRLLDGYIVTIGNELSTAARVKPAKGGADDGAVTQLTENQLQLDSLGEATYAWTAGCPNIISPYYRSLTITYGETGTEYVWNQSSFKGIVLGELSTGSNYITKGPNHIDMILRDPCGSASQSWFEKEKTITREYTYKSTFATEENVKFVSHLGVNATIGFGLGEIVLTDFKSKYDLTTEATASFEGQYGHTYSETTTTTDRVSTSEESEFVGHDGDLFMGRSSNFVWGDNKYLHIEKNNSNQYVLNTGSILSVGQEFATKFVYTEKDIIENEIPKLERLRNDLFKVHTDTVNYVTNLTEDDERYGQEGTYSVVVASNFKKSYTNKVMEYNSYIDGWKQVLANNEAAKVKAINDPSTWLQENVTFSTGVTVEHSSAVSNDSTWVSENNFKTCLHIGFGTGFEWNGTGVEFEVNATNGGGFVSDSTKVNSHKDTYGYKLAETGTTDAISVDVFKAPDGFGPIFVTRAGQTSCPYEDELKTRYYKPGKYTLSAKTMKVEDPDLSAESTIVTGVPSGRPAMFSLVLQNKSEVGEDAYFNIGVVPGTNQQGAALWLNQLNITNGAKILVEAGKKLNQTLTITQSDLSVLDYQGIQVFLQSDCDESLIDYVTLEAHFQPACTDINMAVNSNIINSSNPDASVTLTASGYDKSFSSLKDIKLQMRGSADNYWTTLATYNASQKDQNAADYIPDNGTISYVYPMSNYTDGTYVFRAITDCSFTGIGAIEGESNEVAVVKDTSCPALIAMPSPSDGILDFGDEVSVTFNENIQQNLLSKADNFFVRGVLNGAEVAHDVALNMTGSDAAQTEARIDLSNRDFTIETWLNWSESGTLLQHGSADNNMSVDVDGEGHLVVKMGGQTYTSSATIPSEKWVFIALSYAYDAESKQGMLNASYAKDADEVLLFNRVSAAAYTGNGTLTLGKSIKGQAHELTLWNTSREWPESLSEMYTTKSNYTEHLIGYWPLNEGHGKMGEDRSRNRNLTVADNAWYINGRNFSLWLDESKVSVDISEVTTTSGESYEVEFWFMIDRYQSQAATLMELDSYDLALNVNRSGILELQAKNVTYTVGNENYHDGQWHHLALNVLKSTGGNATIYVDGNQKYHLSASLVPALQAAQLELGGNLRGYIDELRIWKGRRTSDVIKYNMYTRVAADEPGLVAYYPMEMVSVGNNGQMNYDSWAYDLTNGVKRLNAVSGSVRIMNGECPPIQPQRVSNNVDFNFTASERKILINLDDLDSKKAKKLEGCTVLFTLSNVRDLQNNNCEDISWSAYIRQNQLRWSQSEVNVRKLDDHVSTFDVDIVNRGGTTQNWVISNLPTWLTVSNESGTLEPQTSKTVTFMVDAATSIGRHEADIYLTGSMNISEVLVVNVTSAVTPPDWAASSEVYESTMNIVGQLKVDGNISEDGEDIVAAFRGNECVGVAHPLYLKKYDAYYVMMSVNGNANDKDVDLTFKVFDASTGTIYPLVTTSETVVFNPDYIVGTFTSPIVFTPQNAIEQTLALKNGWTWTSVYVTPTTNTLNAIFKNNGGEVTYVKNKSKYAQFSNGVFNGELTGLTVGEMYKVNATTATTTSIIGAPAVPTAVEMTIAPKWNWIGYNCSSFNSLENAFADLSPVDGDIVKGQGSFSIYDDGEWIGNLSVLTPGQGYCYWSLATTTKTFHYPTVTASSRQARAKMAQQIPQYVNTDYENNMSVVAIVKDGDEVLSGAQIAVMSGDEVRGYSAQAVRDDIHFVSVAGKSSSDKLLFVVTYNGFDYLIANSEYYQSDAVLGSLHAPYVLNISDATGIGDAMRLTDNVERTMDNVYDLQGRRIDSSMFNVQGSKLRKGVYIVNGQKTVK